MKARPSHPQLPSIERIREVLSYDGTTGLLTWKPRVPDPMRLDAVRTERETRAWNTKHAGRTAGGTHGRYMAVQLDNLLIMAHRVAWALYTGAWPTGEIDHQDGDPTNNRIANLRDVSRAQNMQNKAAYTSPSGLPLGMHYLPNGKVHLRVQMNGNRVSIGTFTTVEDALEARSKAYLTFGFHPNHGR